jgi:MoaA/NifB/PqqE/SkfB family radical SAM enzyme
MNCDFCFQNKSNKIDIESIKNIPNQLISIIPKDLYRTKSNGILIRLWGGELFSDDIPDSMFEIYQTLVNDIILNLNKVLSNPEIKFVCTSNGVFKNHERVDNFLKKINSELAISYDPIGRFKTKKQIEMFLNTYNYFKNNISCIAITLTKQIIYKIINNDEIFNSFSSDMDIDMNYYVANNGWEIELPNDDDLYNFFIWAIDNNKFNILCKIIHGFILNDKNSTMNSCICKNFTLYSDNEFMNDCVKIMSSFPNKDFYGEHSKSITWENSCEIRATLGFLKRGCLYCEYKELCSGMCWCSIIYKGYNTTQCPIQRLYKYIENHNKIKNLYKEWLNKRGG